MATTLPLIVDRGSWNVGTSRPRSTIHVLRSISILSFALFLGCGYVGPPLPPALNIPVAVSDLSVVQRGSNLIIQFAAPKLTTDGMVLRSLRAVELRVGRMTSLPFDEAAWAGNSKLIDLPAQPGPVKTVVPAGEWINQEIVTGVRISNPKGRFSSWSRVTRRLAPPLAVPADFRAEAVRGGVRLTWRAIPEVSYRVYRADTLLATVTAGEWSDTSTKYGERYQYTVQAFQKSGDIDAESEVSAPVEITPVNKFPPAVSAGLRAIAGTDSIELEWERNTEPDLKGYRIYRSLNGADWERIAEVDVPSYSDHAIKPGQRYQYAVSAIDQVDNESARSAPVEATTP